MSTKNGKRRRLNDIQATPTKGQTENGTGSCGAPRKARKNAGGAAAKRSSPPTGTVRNSNKATLQDGAQRKISSCKLVARDGPGDWQSKAQQFSTERSPVTPSTAVVHTKAAALKQQEEEYFKFVYGDLDQSSNDTSSEASSGAPLSVPAMPVSSSAASTAQWRDHVRGEDLNDDICSVCEEGGTLLCCEGPCSRAFHHGLCWPSRDARWRFCGPALHQTSRDMFALSR